MINFAIFLLFKLKKYCFERFNCFQRNFFKYINNESRSWTNISRTFRLLKHIWSLFFEHMNSFRGKSQLVTNVTLCDQTLYVCLLVPIFFLSTNYFNSGMQVKTIIIELRNHLRLSIPETSVFYQCKTEEGIWQWQNI